MLLRFFQHPTLNVNVNHDFDVDGDVDKDMDVDVDFKLREPWQFSGVCFVRHHFSGSEK